MIYLDSSALVKLAVAETETAALTSYLASNSLPVVTSALSRVEVTRAVVRSADAAMNAADHVLDSVEQIPIMPHLLEKARTTPPVGLRSLDAIHLVTAQLIEPQLAAFVAYDARLCEAASLAGFTTLTPR